MMSERKNICQYSAPNLIQLEVFTKEMITQIINDTEDKTIIQRFDYTQIEAEFINNMFKD